MGPIEATTTCLRKTLHFTGRATRSEFWWFAPIGLAMPILGAIYLPPAINSLEDFLIKGLVVALLATPFNAVCSRRIHDTGEHYAEFWYGICPTFGVLFWGFAVVFGLFAISTIWGAMIGLPFFLLGVPLFIASLVMAPGLLGLTIGQLLTPSSPGSNRYGPNPTEVQS